MQLQQRINAFIELGKFLGSKSPEKEAMINSASAENSWFTADNVRFALDCWSDTLSPEKMNSWLSGYRISETTEKTVAIVMAGNIPLVGFHDFIAVLISGHRVLAKLSSRDTSLLPAIASKLIAIAPAMESRIKFTDEKLSDFDAVIATGSNNTARYFEYYFGKYPHIIRKNRNAVAVLDGSESAESLEALAGDVFRYFGLGCRNVSKIFVPKGYDFDRFFKGMYNWRHLIDHHKYMNNYDYNKAVYLMSNIRLLDNEFMVLKEDSSYASPISVLYYEYYDDPEQLKLRLENESDQIQAVVSETGLPHEVPFGQAQRPQITDYADGVDTVEFLLSL